MTLIKLLGDATTHGNEKKGSYTLVNMGHILAVNHISIIQIVLFYIYSRAIR